MLDVQIIKKRGHFTVDISFSCPDGRLLALTGASGSGKTTIIRALAGLDQPDAGHIKYGDTYWYQGSADICLKARKRRVGYVFQEHTLFPHLSVRKNIAFACRDEDRVSELLDMLGIRHLEHSSPCRISGGERQRTALAQALASNPDVLLLDEPFSALDNGTKARLRARLLRIKEQFSLPIVLVTHDLEEACRLADNHICLDQGVVIPDSHLAPEKTMPFFLPPLPA